MSEELVEVEIELPHDLIVDLALMAHEKNITLNQLIVDILLRAISEEKSIN